jgi:hypothetical protein
MKTEKEALEESYLDLQRVIADLVESFALPHTRTCMRWGKPTREAYREEVVNWLQDYGKSFVRIPKKALSGKNDLPTFARERLDVEIALVLRGQNAAVERSYSHLFD